jgi:hypothetical protein
VAELVVTNTWLMVLCLSILCFRSLEILMVKFCISTRCYSILKLWSDLCHLDNSWSHNLKLPAFFLHCMHAPNYKHFQNVSYSISN